MQDLIGFLFLLKRSIAEYAVFYNCSKEETKQSRNKEIRRPGKIWEDSESLETPENLHNRQIITKERI